MTPRSPRLSGILFTLVFFIGLGLLVYPLVSDYVFQRNVVAGVADYRQTLDGLDEDRIDAMRQAAVAYNNSLRGDPVEDPFVLGSGTALPENYLEVLDMGDGIMGYISIPLVGIHLPIYHGTSDEVLDSGAGHIRQTALPIGGEGNNPVITAHTGHKKADLFNRLIELKEGDTFYLQVLDEVLTYRVFKTEIVEPYYVKSLAPQPGQDRVTLLTCTPYGINSHRLLVHGVRVPTDDTAQAATLTQAGFPFKLVCLSMWGVVLFAVVVIAVRRREARNVAPSATCTT